MLEKYNSKQIITVGFVANILEWYDFSVYAYLASTIGIVFFSESNNQLALIKAFFIFSISYLIRPLGGVFFGYIADKYGRRISLKSSLITMAIPTFLIGLLPAYSTAGLLATSLLIALRLIQGFAAGGELPSSSCYIYEITPNHRKNFFCSFVASSSMFGVLLGSIVAYLLHLTLSETQIQSWAWRIPFLAGGVVALIIFKLRNFIEETDQFKLNSLNNKNDFLNSLLSHKIQIVQVFSLNAFISVAFYLLFVWMPSYLHIFMNMPSSLAYSSGSLGLLALISFTLVVGYISKDTERKKWIAAGIIFIIIMAYPLFSLINQKNFILILMAQLMFAVGLSCIDGVVNATMGSLFDNKIRCSGISIGFTSSTALFGGLAPTICSYLIYKTGAFISPVIFLIVFGMLALPVVISLQSSSNFLLGINNNTT